MLLEVKVMDDHCAIHRMGTVSRKRKFSLILVLQDGIQVTILKDGREWDTFILDQVISKQGLMGTCVRIGGRGGGWKRVF